MDRLGEADEDAGDTELLVEEVFDDVGVETEYAEFVASHDPGEELHDKDFVFERELFVVVV